MGATVNMTITLAGLYEKDPEIQTQRGVDQRNKHKMNEVNVKERNQNNKR